MLYYCKTARSVLECFPIESFCCWDWFLLLIINVNQKQCLEQMLEITIVTVVRSFLFFLKKKTAQQGILMLLNQVVQVFKQQIQRTFSLLFITAEYWSQAVALLF